MINVAECKTCKKRLSAVEYLILLIYNYRTAKTRALYKFTDGLAEWPSNNPPNPDGLGDFHRTMPELTVRDDWQPGQPIWQQFCSDPDADPRLRSGTGPITNPPEAQYLYSHMDLMGNQLTIHSSQTGRKMFITSYLDGLFRFIDDPDCQIDVTSILTRTRAQSNGTEPLLILLASNDGRISLFVTIGPSPIVQFLS